MTDKGPTDSKASELLPEEELAQFLRPERLSRIDEVLSHRSSQLTVVLDGVHNYHNISAVIRSADAFGIRDVHIVGDGSDFSRTISLGAEQWVQLHRHQNPSDAEKALTEAGYRLVVTAPKEYAENAGIESLPVYKLPFHEKLALVFGNEKRGVSKELFSAAKLACYIPMFGFVESFNISVACAIALFCSSIGTANDGRRLPPLQEEEKQQLRANWLRTSVRESDAVLREIQKRSK